MSGKFCCLGECTVTKRNSMQKLPSVFSVSIIILLMAYATCFAQKMPSNHPKVDVPTQLTSPDGSAISGTVLEVINNRAYNYIHVQKDNGDKIWVVVMNTPATVGSRMSFLPGEKKKAVEIKALNRTFDTLYLSAGVMEEPLAYEAPVAKAKVTNVITVKDAFSKSAKLNKRKVIVRGKVVKISVGIMNRNWIHIQDGSGSESKKNNTVVCTSQDLAQVGDIITVSGTLAKDRDFGSGYKYSVIIEDATISK